MTFAIIIAGMMSMLFLSRTENTRERVRIIEKDQCTAISTPKACRELFSRLLNAAGKLQEEQLKELVRESEKKSTTPRRSERASKPKKESTPKQTPKKSPKRVRRAPTAPQTPSNPEVSPVPRQGTETTPQTPVEPTILPEVKVPETPDVSTIPIPPLPIIDPTPPILGIK